MIDPLIQFCLDDPNRTAERANKLFLPQGKAVVMESEDVKNARLAKGRMTSKRNKEQCDAKRSQLLDCYAGTNTPAEAVAKHTGLKLEAVITGLRSRGRVA